MLGLLVAGLARIFDLCVRIVIVPRIPVGQNRLMLIDVRVIAHDDQTDVFFSTRAIVIDHLTRVGGDFGVLLWPTIDRDSPRFGKAKDEVVVFLVPDVDENGDFAIRFKGRR